MQAVVAVGFIAVFILWACVKIFVDTRKYSNDKPEPKTPKDQILPPLPMRPPSLATQERLLFKQLIDMVDDARSAKDKHTERIAWHSIATFAQENIKKLEE